MTNFPFEKLPAAESAHERPPASMSGRTALVTGAAGDIGSAISIHLAANGASVVVTDRDDHNGVLTQTVKRCQAVTNNPVVSYEFDVTDHQQVGEVLEDIRTTVGVCDAVVNNAGYQGQFAPITDVPFKDFEQVMAVNVGGVFSILQHGVSAMMDAGVPGSIVNVASMAGVGGAPNMPAYSASKSAVIGLTKAAAKDVAASQIRINSVSPGFIGSGAMWDRQVQAQATTPSQYYSDDPEEVAKQMISQVPLGRPGTLEEVAESVLFMLSESASFITGFNLELAGGGA